MKKSVLILAFVGIFGVLNAQNYYIVQKTKVIELKENQGDSAKEYVKEVEALNKNKSNSIYEFKQRFTEISKSMDRIIQNTDKKLKRKKVKA